MKIYELVDYTNEEMYFSHGVFSDKESAKAALSSGMKKNNPISDLACESERWEINERLVGDLTTELKVVCVLSREAEYLDEYDDDGDDFVWSGEWVDVG